MTGDVDVGTRVGSSNISRSGVVMTPTRRFGGRRRLRGCDRSAIICTYIGESGYEWVVFLLASRQFANN